MKDCIELKIFITGVYRSGTTLLSRILNNHPKLWVTYDSIHFMRFCYGKYNPIQSVRNAESLVKDLHVRILRRWDMSFNINTVISNLHDLKTVTYRDCYEFIMRELVLQGKKNAVGWGEKTNVCWGQIPNFLSMFPEDGKVLHIVRDPRDVLCSYREHTYERAFAYLDSVFCSLHSLTKAYEYSAMIDKNKYYCLRYEDLLGNPQQEVEKICNFLGVSFELNMLDVTKFTNKKGKRWGGNSAFVGKSTAISTEPIGRWRKSSNAMEVFLVESINKEYMLKFNYKISNVKLDEFEMNKLFDILRGDKLLHARHEYWLKTGQGVEGYPSDPTKK